ncbi:succinylglutamate desuccinylase/aspartoacylase family protein [Mesorhizobium sp. A623]
MPVARLDILQAAKAVVTMTACTEFYKGGNMNDLKNVQLNFSSSVLAGWSWQAQEIKGSAPGPRLCVMSGVHVNEVSCIEAAFRLRSFFRENDFRGTVSIMPLANPPAWPERSEYICPIDDKNINFTFPGRPDGTFSEALCDALLNEWARDAACLIDLHGGDMCEEVAQFTVAPTIGDRSFDDFNLALAQAFDPEIIVTLPPSNLVEPGRSCSGRARQKQHAAFSEAGAHGVVDENSVSFHVNGVLRVAKLLDMIDEAPPASRRAFVADEYHWVPAGADGWFRPMVHPGDEVASGQVIGTIDDFGGRRLNDVRSPADGRVLWRWTHSNATADLNVFGVAS